MVSDKNKVGGEVFKVYSNYRVDILIENYFNAVL